MQIDLILKRDYVLYLSGKIIPGLAGVISVPIFLRLFGEAVYGEFALIYSLFLMLVTSATGWLTNGIIRFYDETTDKPLFRKAILLVVLKIISLMLILAIPILVYFNYYSVPLIAIIGLSLFLATYYTISIAVHQAKLLAKKIAVADSLRAIIFIITPCVLYFISPLFALLTGVLFSFLAGIVFLNLKTEIKFQFRNILSVLFRENPNFKNIIRPLWTYGWPLTIWLFLATLLNISDRFIIDYYYGLEKAGEYSAIYDMSSKIFKFLLAPLTMAIFPILVKLSNENNNKKSGELLRKAIFYELFVFSFLIFAIFIFKDFLISEILKFKNADSVEPLVIPIFIGSFLWQLSMLIHKPLELKKETLKMVGAVLLATLVNFILNLIFIPIYGYIVAAYTTIIGSLAYIISIYIINYRLNSD